MANKNYAVFILVAFSMLVVICSANETDDSLQSSSKPVKSATLQSLNSAARFKRGYGHGGGGGGGGGHGGYGHGPGAGGGARGPVYFCGWVGSKMGSGGYGYHG